MERYDFSQQPIACDLTAFHASERERHLALSQELFARCREIRELPDGFAFLFPGEDSLFQEVAAWATQERRCCPFMSFGLVLAAESGAAELRLCGPEGTKGFLRGALGAFSGRRGQTFP